MIVGKCKVCDGEITDVVMSFGSQFYCKKCGISYHKVPKELCNENGLRMEIWR